jgi:hypothetical protein
MREFLCGGRNLDLPGQTDGRRRGLAELAECPEMALDRFPNVPLGLFKGLSRRDASWQIGNVSRPIALGLLKNDSVSLAHGFVSNPVAFRIDFSAFG